MAYDPVLIHLGFSPNEKDLYKYVYKNFIHHGPKCEITQCLSVGKWVNELWYNHTVDYLLVTKE